MKEFFPIPYLEVSITSNCNMACLYCFERTKNHRSIDMDKVINLMEDNSIPVAISLFGGEPFLETANLEKLYNFLTEKYSDRKKLMSSIKSLITNGTLIENHQEFIKKHKINCQISLDGSKDCHDANRKFISGQGTFDSIMRGLKCCQENKLEYSFHGVLSRNNIKYLSDSIKMWFDLYRKSKSVDESIDAFHKNWAMIIMEEEWTDTDIDQIILEFHKIIDWIAGNNEFTDSQKREFLDHITTGNVAAICGAGTSLTTISQDFELFPCHRISENEYKKDFNIGRVDSVVLGNKRLWNALSRIRFLYKYMYSCCFNGIDAMKSQANWCPATNYETSGNIYYQNCKYNTLIYELNRFFVEARKEYFYIGIIFCGGI